MLGRLFFQCQQVFILKQDAQRAACAGGAAALQQQLPAGEAASGLALHVNHFACTGKADGFLLGMSCAAQGSTRGTHSTAQRSAAGSTRKQHAPATRSSDRLWRIPLCMLCRRHRLAQPPGQAK